jgi:hypothetical protein
LIHHALTQAICRADKKRARPSLATPFLCANRSEDRIGSQLHGFVSSFNSGVSSSFGAFNNGCGTSFGTSNSGVGTSFSTGNGGISSTVNGGINSTGIGHRGFFSGIGFFSGFRAGNQGQSGASSGGNQEDLAHEHIPYTAKRHEPGQSAQSPKPPEVADLPPK